MSAKLVVHRGSCHCKAVEFKFNAVPILDLGKCGCSICLMKKNMNTVVSKSYFRLLRGEDVFTVYTVNTYRAKCLFYKVCVVKVFYFPHSNSDGVTITVGCIGSSALQAITLAKFDGANWEAAYVVSYSAKCSHLCADVAYSSVT